MKKKIFIVLLIIACCLVVMLGVRSSIGKGSGTLYSGGNNLVVGTMLPNGLPSLTWERTTSVNGDMTLITMSTQYLTGKVNDSDNTVSASLTYVICKGGYVTQEKLLIYFNSGNEYVPVNGAVHFIVGSQNTEYSADVSMGWNTPSEYNINNYSESIANLFKNVNASQEIKMRIVDNNDSNKYVEFAFTKGNFDEVYYAE